MPIGQAESRLSVVKAFTLPSREREQAMLDGSLRVHDPQGRRNASGRNRPCPYRLKLGDCPGPVRSPLSLAL